MQSEYSKLIDYMQNDNFLLTKEKQVFVNALIDVVVTIKCRYGSIK